MLMPIQQEMLFDLMQGESDANIFLDRDNFRAEKPAIIIISSLIGHFPKQKGDKYTLWFGYGIERFSFKTLKESVKKVMEILNTANTKIFPRIEGRNTNRIIKLMREEYRIIEERIG